MLVSESYARAVSTKVLPLDQQASYIDAEMKNGYILTKYFYDRYDEFKSFNGTIEEFLKKIVAEIK